MGNCQWSQKVLLIRQGVFSSHKPNFPGLLVSVFSNQIFNTSSAGVILQQFHANKFIGKNQEKTRVIKGAALSSYIIVISEL